MPVIDAAQSALAGAPVAGPPDVNAAMREAALERVLRSPVFQKNPRLSALLTYLCVRATHSERESPKEYSIATDVFGLLLETKLLAKS